MRRLWNFLPARRAEVLFLLLLTLGAFGLRLYHAGSAGLADDEAQKWAAIQQYRQGKFIGVDSEHPMLMKLLAWASLGLGQRWNQWAGERRWMRAREEAILRMPNLLAGALTAIVIYLLGKKMFGPVAGGCAAFFWAFTPMPVALNRTLKEDTLLTLFTLCGFYVFWLAKETPEDARARRVYSLSAACFGLALASKYILHYMGLNFIAWGVAGSEGLDRRPSKRFRLRFFAIVALTFVLTNPVILSLANLRSATSYMLHSDTIRHGYNLGGKIYMNKIGLTPFGLPWYFYFWVIGVKTPIPVLLAIVAGGIVLFRARHTFPGIALRVMIVVTLFGFSLLGAKWIRYLLATLPFIFLVAGYAMQTLHQWLAGRPSVRVKRLGMVMAAVFFLVWPAAETISWTPRFNLYLNLLGGGRANAGRVFPPDELYDAGLREALTYTCQTAPPGTTIAVTNQAASGYYLGRCGRKDLRLGWLFDAAYSIRPGDYVIIQESRRYFETDQVFRLVERHGLLLKAISVDDIRLATVYRL